MLSSPIIHTSENVTVETKQSVLQAKLNGDKWVLSTRPYPQTLT